MTIWRWIRLTASAAAAVSATACAPTTVPPTARAPQESPAVVERSAILPAPTPDAPQVRIEAAIEHVRRRELLTTHGFWTVFHGILGLGLTAELRDPLTGTRTNAVDYIFRGGALRGLEFLPMPHGLDVRTGPMFVGQGHQDQFVAEMAQWGMSPDRPVRVLGREYAFRDFIHHTQMRARVTANQELGWAVLVIGQYLGLDAAWTNAAGERLTVEDLVRYELDQPMDTAPCGGTHRLFGLSWVYHLHLRRGGRTNGVWQAVADRTAQHRDEARKYQNADGSLSTNFFRGPGGDADDGLRLNTTGHMLEWLALALSDAELREPWVQDAASTLALMILDQRDAPVEGGSLYHAVHGLIIYRDRVWGRPSPAIPLPPTSGPD